MNFNETAEKQVQIEDCIKSKSHLADPFPSNSQILATEIKKYAPHNVAVNRGKCK